MKKKKSKKTVKNKNKRISILVVIGTIVITFPILLAYDFNQRQLLTKEIEKIHKLDITKDKIDTTIKTKNIYAKIEKTIKEYYQELFQYQKTYIEKSAAAFLNRIDITYLKDNKNNLKDLNLIEAVQENEYQVDQAIQKIVAMLDEETIKNRFQEHQIFLYYKNFYYEKMIKDDYEIFQKDWENEIQIQKEKSETLKKLIQLLIDHQNEWYIENDQLYFTKQQLADTYNQYYDEIYQEK